MTLPVSTRAPETSWTLRTRALLLALLLPTLGLAAPPAEGDAQVVLRDSRVLRIATGRGGVSAADRARAASQALLRAHEADPGAAARVEQSGEEATVRVGQVPVLTLGPEDVAAARAAGIAQLAARAAADVDHALRAERRRERVAEVVFNVSLAVLSGLLAWLLLRKLGDLEDALRDRIRTRQDPLPALRVRGVEVVSRAGISGALLSVLRVARVLAQVGLAYGWVVFTLSLFPATRSAGQALGNVVLRPAVGTLLRIGSAIPSTVALLVALGVLVLVVQAIRTFSHSVARGETHVHWLPAELARPAGQLAAIVVVLVAVIFAGPVLAGSDDGILAAAGWTALLLVALSATPVLATVAAGLPRLFARTYRTDHVAEIGATSGTIQSVGLLGVELRDATGRTVLVPHLAALLAPTRLPGLAPSAHVEVRVDPAEDQARVREVLLRATGPEGHVSLVLLDGLGARWQVAGPGSDLAVRVAAALRAESIRLAGGSVGAGAGT